MVAVNGLKVALVSPGDRVTRDQATIETSRMADVGAALQAFGHHVEAAIYNDDFSDEVKDQLLGMDLVLVWVNPVHEGRTRTTLDQMLREVADQGVLVSAHPDAIMALGTKQVLYDTQDVGWGCHTNLYRTPDQLLDGLTRSLDDGPRVVKQHRGSSGAGVWSVALSGAPDGPPGPKTSVRVRQAKRGSVSETLRLDEFCERLQPYLADGGLLVDQAFQPRIADGMVRCYLVKDRVAGFGLQQINALIPAPQGEAPPEAGPRLYHPPTLPQYQRLRRQLEEEWLPHAIGLVDLTTEQLPLLWDCDFLLGPVDELGLDTYVLCEINVSSVAPYPESVVPVMVRAIDQLTDDLTG